MNNYWIFNFSLYFLLISNLLNENTVNIQKYINKYIHYCLDTNIKEIQNSYIIEHQLNI